MTRPVYKCRRCAREWNALYPSVDADPVILACVADHELESTLARELAITTAHFCEDKAAIGIADLVGWTREAATSPSPTPSPAG